jgi:2-deoxy-D-gluconate 3-dehydrogenase
MQNDLFDLTGKVALVTGTSAGLGQSVAIGLAKAGATVVGVSRRDSVIAEKEIAGMGGTFHQINADVSEIDRYPDIVGEIKDKYGKIDILVNNAGIIDRNPAEQVEPEGWDRVINLNQRAAFFLSQAVGREFIKQQTGGKIINICSIRTFQGGSGVCSYTASKTALAGITRALATEWAKYNIQVNGIAPGFFETEINTAIKKDKKRNDAIVSAIPAGRWGRPEELQGTVIYLASKASDYMNGHIVVLDGGYMA